MSKKALILFTAFIDILGVGIIIPVLPFYVETFGASDLTVTLLFAVFSFFSFFSVPSLGALSDRIGRRYLRIGGVCRNLLRPTALGQAPAGGRRSGKLSDVELNQALKKLAF